MQKEKSDGKVMLKEAAILFIITLFSGLALGFIHELTAENIAKQEALAIENACRQVFAEAARFEEIDYTPGQSVVEKMNEYNTRIGKIYRAQNAENSSLGYVIESASMEGYGGKIDLYIGVTNGGDLNGISILEINETAGLGMEAGNVLVPQFQNKQIAEYTYTKTGSNSDTEIDAISGATITTKAVVNAVNTGIAAAVELITEGGVHE